MEVLQMKWSAILICTVFFMVFIDNLSLSYASEDDLGVDLTTYLNNIRKQFIELRKSKEKDELPMYVEKIHIELYVIPKLSDFKQASKKNTKIIRFTLSDIALVS